VFRELDKSVREEEASNIQQHQKITDLKKMPGALARTDNEIESMKDLASLEGMLKKERR
jgi:hypothetical protein